MQAYLRQSVINRIRDEVRRIGRHPPRCELPEDLPSEEPSPRGAGGQRRSRVEVPRGARRRSAPAIDSSSSPGSRRNGRYDEIATHFGMPTPDAARMAVSRALRRLMDSVKKPEGD